MVGIWYYNESGVTEVSSLWLDVFQVSQKHRGSPFLAVKKLLGQWILVTIFPTRILVYMDNHNEAMCVHGTPGNLLDLPPLYYNTAVWQHILIVHVTCWSSTLGIQWSQENQWSKGNVNNRWVCVTYKIKPEEHYILNHVNCGKRPRPKDVAFSTAKNVELQGF